MQIRLDQNIKKKNWTTITYVRVTGFRFSVSVKYFYDFISLSKWVDKRLYYIILKSKFLSEGICLYFR